MEIRKESNLGRASGEQGIRDERQFWGRNTRELERIIIRSSGRGDGGEERKGFTWGISKRTGTQLAKRGWRGEKAGAVGP